MQFQCSYALLIRAAGALGLSGIDPAARRTGPSEARHAFSDIAEAYPAGTTTLKYSLEVHLGMKLANDYDRPAESAPDDRQVALDSWIDPDPHSLRGTITFLIQHRELLRDEEISRLERESQSLTARAKDLDRRKLKEELECFQDVLAMHKRLIENGGS